MWLGEIGPRWGLPAAACRVHAVRYLAARPLSTHAIGEELGGLPEETAPALEWLQAQGLVEASPEGWRTGIDPWALMMQALEARRTHELSEAGAVIDYWRRECGGEDPLVSRQAERLFDLVEDIAAMEAGTRHLSAATTRGLIRLGGRTARLIERATGMGGRR